MNGPIMERIFVPRSSSSGVVGSLVAKEPPRLNAIQAALENDLVQVLLVFNSSRLDRRDYQCMKFVVQDVVSEGKRAIILKNNINTDQDGSNGEKFLFSGD